MIAQEHFTLNGRNFIRTYSDAGCYVVRDGIAYSEACDPAELNRQYIEGDLLPAEERQQITEEILDILLGVSE